MPHRELREQVRRLGLKLFGDLQVGLSPRDDWAAQAFLMRRYRMGAPPSRTNPEGQAWNHAVLDPACYFERGPDGAVQPGPALRFLRARMDKMFAELDGVRIERYYHFICRDTGRVIEFRNAEVDKILNRAPMPPSHLGIETPWELQQVLDKALDPGRCWIVKGSRRRFNHISQHDQAGFPGLRLGARVSEIIYVYLIIYQNRSNIIPRIV